jgi:two-component system, response regulator YesN
MIMNNSFLWIDFQHHTTHSALFETLSAHYNTRKVNNPSDMYQSIREDKPLFLCFEFDTPHNHDLEILQVTKQCYPELPILMITNPHTEALAVWAFRSGVRDYLTKPCANDYLMTSIRVLVELGEHRREESCRRPLFFPTPPNESLLEHHDYIEDTPKTKRALSFLDKHFTEDVRLSTVSELCGLSESGFSRTFKKEQSITFSEYVMKKRIDHACELLKKPSMQIKAVAFSVGFNDLSYFTRIFRRYLGVTPSAYQRRPEAFVMH